MLIIRNSGSNIETSIKTISKLNLNDSDILRCFFILKFSEKYNADAASICALLGLVLTEV
ncbi:hypothetical protein [Duganella sacchari]|uniref:hypothetical protein n=1 Tax=Duganella sacchari TaxID=551987 RepID=UPI001E36A28D|nr:hypothetical protein [Duganella sacchari]